MKEYSTHPPQRNKTQLIIHFTKFTAFICPSLPMTPPDFPVAEGLGYGLWTKVCVEQCTILGYNDLVTFLQEVCRQSG